MTCVTSEKLASLVSPLYSACNILLCVDRVLFHQPFREIPVAKDSVPVKNPGTIKVLGDDIPIEYLPGRLPCVRIDFLGDNAYAWQNLPDEGVRLADGTEVMFCALVEGYRYYVEAKSSKFKKTAREFVNHQAWHEFSKPDLPSPEVSIPEIVAFTYGSDAMTGEPLVGYGTFVYDSWYSTFWRPHFTCDKAEAEHLREKAIERFSSERNVADRKALKKRLGELHAQHYDNSLLPLEMRERLRVMYYAFPSGVSAAEIRAFIITVEAEAETQHVLSSL